MTSAAVQAPGPVMWCATLNRAMAGPAPWGRGEVQDHPGADAGDPHARRRDAGAAQRPAVGADPQVRSQAADRAQGRAGRQAEQVQRNVAAAARHGVQEHHGGGADGQDRDRQGPQVELVLADLADDEEDEQRVGQVNVHAASVPRGPGRARHPVDGSPG